MSQSRNQLVFFTIAFVIVLVLTYFIFSAFLIVIMLAAMLAVILQPVYKKTLGWFKGRKSLAALATLVFLIIVIVIPLIFIGTQIVYDAQSLYVKVATGSDVPVDTITQVVEGYGKKIYPAFTFDTRAYIAFASSWVVSHLGGFFSGTLDFILKLFLTMAALFYFLRDGATFKKHIIALSPLNDKDDELLLSNVKTSINSILLGSMIIAVVQGVLTGVGFAIFGVPNAVLWGTTAAIASFVPGVGTSIVWIPGVLYLLFVKTGLYWIGELIWSIALVSTIDNFLSPYILQRGINIHPVIILFSILGGISFFGPIGFIIGPLVVSLLFSLMRIYEKGSNATLQ